MLTGSLRSKRKAKPEPKVKPWSDRRKWTMDLLKSAIGFTAGSAITLSVIDHLQGKRTEAKDRVKAQEDARFAARVKAYERLRDTVDTGFDRIIQAVRDVAALPEDKKQRIDKSKVDSATTEVVSSINVVMLLFPNRSAELRDITQSFDKAVEMINSLIKLKMGEAMLFLYPDFEMTIRIAQSQTANLLLALQNELLGIANLPEAPTSSPRR